MLREIEDYVGFLLRTHFGFEENTVAVFEVY